MSVFDVGSAPYPDARGPAGQGERAQGMTRGGSLLFFMDVPFFPNIM